MKKKSSDGKKTDVPLLKVKHFLRLPSYWLDEPLLDFDIISIKIIRAVLKCILSRPKISLSSSPTNPLLFNPPLNQKQKINICCFKCAFYQDYIKIICAVLICILSRPEISLSSSPTDPLLFKPPQNQNLHVKVQKPSLDQNKSVINDL